MEPDSKASVCDNSMHFSERTSIGIMARTIKMDSQMSCQQVIKNKSLDSFMNNMELDQYKETIENMK
jgi:hypothetical protein